MLIFKSHQGFYRGNKHILEKFRNELEPWHTSTPTLYFPAENPLPAGLVTKIVKARVAENEARAAEKKGYRK